MKNDQLPSISLYCTKDGADKEYHAKITEVEGGYSVNTRFGKRGAAKVPKAIPPVLSLEEAIKEFESIIKEKTSPKKGYTTDESGVGYATSEIAGSMSGNLPHLLVPITFEKLEELATDDNYLFQEKIDGERLMIDKKDNGIVTSNKLGVINTIINSIVDEIKDNQITDFLLDGENKNGVFYIFDVLRFNGKCLKSYAFSDRYAVAQQLCFGESVKLVPCIEGTKSKQSFIKWAKEQNGNQLVEGVVAKNIQSAYIPGRAKPSEAKHLKYKFLEDSSFVVVDVSKTKRSVTIGLYNDQGELSEFGNVGVPANHTMPLVNDVIDVQYRHWFMNGDLCQPVFLKPRTDVLVNECLFSQLSRVKIKDALAATEMDDEDDC